MTTIALIADRAGLPRQTVYRNYATQVELFRSCIAFGLELNPLPDPDRWLSVTDPGERLQVGLTQLYQWFEAGEPVLTNTMRDFGAVQESAEAMQPVGEVLRHVYETLSQGWESSRVSPLLSLAVDFATWRKLRREQGMASSGIVEMWSDLIRFRQPRNKASPPSAARRLETDGPNPPVLYTKMERRGIVAEATGGRPPTNQKKRPRSLFQNPA